MKVFLNEKVQILHPLEAHSLCLQCEEFFGVFFLTFQGKKHFNGNIFLSVPS